MPCQPRSAMSKRRCESRSSKRECRILLGQLPSSWRLQQSVWLRGQRVALAGAGYAAPLLSRAFRLIDRSNSLAWQQFASSRPFARTDSYLHILVGRIPAEEPGSDRFELWWHEDGSVLIVSHLADDRTNITEWGPVDGSWKARAMSLNPPEGQMAWVASNLKPILTR
jgi:hypothetical protein